MVWCIALHHKDQEFAAVVSISKQELGRILSSLYARTMAGFPFRRCGLVTQSPRKARIDVRIFVQELFAKGAEIQFFCKYDTQKLLLLSPYSVSSHK